MYFRYYAVQAGVPNEWVALLQRVTQAPEPYPPGGSTPSQQMGEDEAVVCLLLNHRSPEAAHTAGPHLDIQGCVGSADSDSSC